MFLPCNDFNGADQAGFKTGSLQNGFHHIGRGGLSLGAGDPDNLHFFRRVPVPGRRDQSHGITAVLHLDHRNLLWDSDRSLHHDGGSSLTGHLRRVLMPVRHGPLNTEKQRIRNRLAGVVYNRLYLLVQLSLDACIIQSFQ